MLYHYKNTVTNAEFWSERECKGGDWVKLSPAVACSEKKQGIEAKEPVKTGRRKKS